VTAFDWQLVRRGRGACDVAYFMTGVDTSSDREGVPRRLLGAYHDELLTCGVRDYSLEQLEFDSRVASFYFVCVVVLAGGLLDFSSERGQFIATSVLRRVGSLGRRFNLPALASSDFS
jgi:hypothetical protein